MSGKNWAPGFIELTRKAAGKISVRIDAVLIYEGMNRTGGTTVRIQEFPDWIQVEETPEQIADLIRQEWEHRTNRGAEIRWASTRGERL